MDALSSRVRGEYDVLAAASRHHSRAINADESSSVSSFSDSDDCQVFDREDAESMNQLNAQSGKNDVMGRFGELSGCVMMPIDEAVKKIESFTSEPLQSVPDGNKSNMFYMIDNTRNAKTKGPKLYRDDCWAWRGSSHKLLYKRQEDGPFKRVVIINKKFCIYKSNTDPNKSSNVHPIEPQPNDEVLKQGTDWKKKTLLQLIAILETLSKLQDCNMKGVLFGIGDFALVKSWKGYGISQNIWNNMTPNAQHRKLTHFWLHGQGAVAKVVQLSDGKLRVNANPSSGKKKVKSFVQDLIAQYFFLKLIWQPTHRKVFYLKVLFNNLLFLRRHLHFANL